MTSPWMWWKYAVVGFCHAFLVQKYQLQQSAGDSQILLSKEQRILSLRISPLNHRLDEILRASTAPVHREAGAVVG